MSHSPSSFPITRINGRRIFILLNVILWLGVDIQKLKSGMFVIDGQVGSRFAKIDETGQGRGEGSSHFEHPGRSVDVQIFFHTKNLCFSHKCKLANYSMLIQKVSETYA